MEAQLNAERFSRAARALGFDRIGFSPVGPVARHVLYREWLSRGYAGEMAYLARGVEPRRDPRALFESARTVVSVALSYAGRSDVVPPERLGGGPRGRIARYARGEDYHLVLKHKLRALAARVAEEIGRTVAFLPCVDTAPLLEREAAQAAGIGFIAKNTMLIAPGAGSYLLLGELLTELECAPGADLSDAAPRCGQCRRCLDACPTGAFVDAHTLDARRCISYLTIELPGAIPRELRPLVGDHVFGCDVCQEVCPFNAAPGTGAPELAPRPGYDRPSLVQLLGLGAAQFRKWNARSALRRVHRRQLLRNVAVALGNVGTAAELPALARALTERHPLIRMHVSWAIGEIGRRTGAPVHALLTSHRAVELDAAVREEIDVALAISGAQVG